MNNNMIITERYDSERVERVQHFFDEPLNYLARSRANIRVRAETVEAFLRNRDFNTILDVGCGDGSLSVPLLTPQRQLTLLDISPNMLSSARARIPQDLLANVDMINSEFLVAPLTTGHYDVVICIGVLAHISSPNDIIRKIATILKPNGVLILQCTDSSHFSRKIISLYHRCLFLIRPGLYKAGSLTNDEVLRMITEQGFRPAAEFCYGGGFLPGLHRIFSQDTLYRMRRRIFGDALHNRNRWFGCEHIYALVRD